MANFFQITRTEFTVAQYIGWIRNNELELNPNFQRRSVWKPAAKSYFIDTVARGLPVPIVFLRERTDLNTLRTIREVVDGQQRLRTLISYIASDLLKDFKEDRDGFIVRKIHNEDLFGKKFQDLSVAIKEHILSYQISTHVLPSSTSDAEVLDMFRRMNASGVKLTAQELRNAKFFGEFSQLSKNFANEYLDSWRRWRVFSETDFARMREVEFVSELLILIESGLQEKTQARIDAIYKKYDDQYPNSEWSSNVFREIMSDISKNIGDRIWTTPFSNSSVFYSLFASLLDIRVGAAVKGSRPKALKDTPAGILTKLPEIGRELSDRDTLPASVREALISRSNRLSNRKEIRDFISQRLLGDAIAN